MPKVTPIDLSRLRRQINELECGTGGVDTPPISLGIRAIDTALPWGGLARGGLHEIDGGGGAGFGFHAGLLRCAAGATGHILWCRHAGIERETGLPYGPGLACFGLAVTQFLFVRARRPVDVLWAMEEGLRAGNLAAVVGDGITADFTATRRLQLAAEASGTPAFLLMPPAAAAKAAPLSAALTRWRIRAAPGRSDMCWQSDLRRCRGGAPRTWTVEWHEQTLCFNLVASLVDRAATAG